MHHVSILNLQISGQLAHLVVYYENKYNARRKYVSYFRKLKKQVNASVLVKDIQDIIHVWNKRCIIPIA